MKLSFLALACISGVAAINIKGTLRGVVQAKIADKAE